MFLDIPQPPSTGAASGLLPEITELLKEFITWGHNDLVAACSAFVALCALFLSMWQAHATVRHNKLSVRPHIDFNYSRANDEPVSLSIINDGLGPAFIKALAITYEGISYDIDKRAMLEELFDKLTHAAHIRCTLPRPGVAIRPGQEVTLFAFYRSVESQAFHNKAVTVSNKIGLKLVYKSIYGKRFVEKMQT